MGRGGDRGGRRARTVDARLHDRRRVDLRALRPPPRKRRRIPLQRGRSEHRRRDASPWPFLLAPFAHGPALAVLVRAKAVGFTAWLVSACLWGVAVGRAPAALGSKVAALGLHAACLPVGAHAISGMETGVVIAIATAAAVARRPLLGSGLAGAAASLRPEMVVWAVVLALTFGEPRRAVARVSLAMAPFTACAVARVIAFGRPSPLAVFAKPSDLAHGAAYAAAAAAIALAPLAVFAPIALARAEPRARSLALAGACHFGAIAVAGGDWMPYARLAAPIVPSLLYAFVLAAPEMSRVFAGARVGLSLAFGGYVLVRIAPGGRHVEAHVSALVRAATAGPGRRAQDRSARRGVADSGQRSEHRRSRRAHRLRRSPLFRAVTPRSASTPHCSSRGTPTSSSSTGDESTERASTGASWKSASRNRS